MKRFLIGAAILALATCGAETASARGPRSGSGSGSHNVQSYNQMSQPSMSQKSYSGTSSKGNWNLNYRQMVGSKCPGGTCYRGRNCCFWNYRCWSSSYGCYCFYDPCCSSYYYWCSPDSCYYPISYCPHGRYSW